MADFLEEIPQREAIVHVDRRAAAAAELARLAGKIALDYFERAEVSWKADDSMVTDADVAGMRDDIQEMEINMLRTTIFLKPLKYNLT